jgi:putative chitinase
VDWLIAPEGAALSAGLFWKDNNLNKSADADDIRTNTRIINGGFNGLHDRIERLNDAKQGLAEMARMPDFSDVQGGVA